MPRKAASEDLERLTDRERVILENTLLTLRRGGWFGRWLAVQVKIMANSKTHSERFPTPQQIAATLNEVGVKTGEKEMELARAKRHGTTSDQPEVMFALEMREKMRGLWPSSAGRWVSNTAWTIELTQEQYNTCLAAVRARDRNTRKVASHA